MKPVTALAAAPASLAVIYLRVSTKEQAERGGDSEGFSIPAQRDACLRKAQALGATVIEQFVDRGESARSAHRPELQRMLRYIQEQRISYAIVHKSTGWPATALTTSRSTWPCPRRASSSSPARRTSTRRPAACSCTAS